VGSLVYRDLFSAAVNAARCSSYSLGFSIVTGASLLPKKDLIKDTAVPAREGVGGGMMEDNSLG
jgi:hypothetical protein